MFASIELSTLACRNLCLLPLALPQVVQSTYLSELTTNTSEYIRDSCETGNSNYEALQINVSVSGVYRLLSKSLMDTYGYLYRDTFDPFEPSRNQIASDDDDCNGGQFRLEHLLQKNTTYILVVTTHQSNVQGPFTVIATSEESRVHFTRLSKYQCC